MSHIVQKIRDCDFNHLINYINNYNDFNPKPDSVGKSGLKKVWEPAVRKSSSISGIKISNECWKEYNEILNNFHIDHRFICEDFTLHKYEPGDFFKAHKDSRKQVDTVGTFLIIPPKSVSNYMGGILELGIGKNKVEIRANEKSWKFVIFDLETEHAVTEITSGCRYVFKTSINQKDFYIPRNIERTLSCSDVKEYKLRKIQNKIDKLLLRKSEIEAGNFRKVKNVLDFIDGNCGDGIIILKTAPSHSFYISEDDLEGQDKLIWNTVYEKYPGAFFRKFKCHFTDKDYKNIQLDEKEIGAIDVDLTDYYPYDEAPGEYVSSESEYNDEGGYYNNYTHSVICLIIKTNDDDDDDDEDDEE